MKNYARIISCYAADTAGVCSALYEMGGMIVVHDASGCNSTYTTHDEPRWYDKRSMIYISGLTEIDSVMGNDQRLVDDVCTASAELDPKFIAICGSPMPMMTGTDFDAIAREIQGRSGIKTLALHTDGMHSYTAGASEAFRAAAETFVSECPKAKGIGVNIVGATPLDFSVNGSAGSIENWLTECGFGISARIGMGGTLEEIKNAGSARVNLVVSHCGIAAAEYMLSRMGIPYVCGVPIGRKFSARLAESLWTAAQEGLTLFPCADRKTDSEGLQIIGESVFSGSLAAAIMLETGKISRVICPLDHDERAIAEGDLTVSSEKGIRSALTENGIDGVIADPLYKPICPKESRFFSLPSEAFSGRCFRKSIPDLINRNLKENLKEKDI